MFRWLQREPKQLAERRQILSPVLADYPLYQPPHRQGPNFARRRRNQTEKEHAGYVREFSARMEENFQYFMDERATRLAALEAFLSKFSVKASLDDAGLGNVSAWLPDNDYALVDGLRDSAVLQAFFQMQTSWIGGLRGLNVIFDLGIFLGESLIRRQPRLYWKYIGGSSDHGESFSTGYKIDGFLGRTKVHWFDPAGFILGCCMNDLNDISSYSPTPKAFRNYDILTGVVRDYSTR